MSLNAVFTRCGAVALAGSTLFTAASAQPRFTNVASTREGYGINAGDRGAVNSSGDFLFTALSGGIAQLFRSTGGAPATLVVDSTGGYDSFGDVAINDAGQIAFGARLDNFGRRSVFSGPDPVADDRTPDRLLPRSVPGALSANGTVLVSEEYRSGQNYYDVLYTAKNGVSTEIARSRPGNAGPFRYIDADGSSIASDGQVAFSAYTPGPLRTDGIYADGAGNAAWVTSQNSVDGVPFFGFFNQGLASNGRLIFSAATDDGTGTFRTGVFVTDGSGGFSRVAEEGGLFSGFDNSDGFGERMIIADDGRIAFEATLLAGGKAIYTGSDTGADRLIGTGDALFGSTVTNVFITPGSYASNGNLIVRYTLADGTQGFASASDYSISTRAGVSIVQAVPEPASLAVLGVGLVALTRRRKSKASR